MQSTPQVGHRPVSVSPSSIMASFAFIKDTGIVCLLLSGILSPSVLVSGQNTTLDTISTSPAATMAAASTSSGPNQIVSTTMAMTTTNPTTKQSTGMTTGSSAATQSTMSTSYEGTAMSTVNHSPTTSTYFVSQSTHSASTTSGGLTSSNTNSPSTTSGESASHSSSSPSTTTGGSASHSTHSASSTSGGSSSVSIQSPSTTSGGSSSTSTKSPSTSSGGSVSHSTRSASSTSGGSSSSSTQPTLTGSSTSHTTQTLSSTSEGGTTTANINTTLNSSMDMIYCPSFSCYYSECYSMYTSRNASKCAAGESCQSLRSMDMWYNASCSASCAESCTNSSQTNCSVNCCNSTDCLSDDFASMNMTTTTVATTATTNAPPTTTSTTANNGNKCHKGTCTGKDCYTGFKSLVTCSSNQPHCQSKKETSENGDVWTAGCANCTGYAACSGTAKPPCNQECCTATTTSCLMSNGTSNVPSFATRGPHLHTELIASLFCSLAIALLS